jgi:cytochrome c biogenesis protein CcdA/thiol-disulfide isomerase/thioredoxin
MIFTELNVGLAFLEGFALIISPCILPILPIILSGSLTGSKKRPLGIICGFVLIFSLFTLFSRQLVQISGIDLNLVRQISFGLLFVFGLIMLSTALTEIFSRMTQRLVRVGSSLTTVNNSEGGFFSGILFGSLIGLIWTPCAGPILAAVIVQSVIQTTTAGSFLTVIAFGVGAAVPMLIIALVGRRIMAKFAVFKNHTALFRQLLGIVIILSIIFMMIGVGAVAPIKTGSSADIITDLKHEVKNPYVAPELEDITAWINSRPLQITQLKGYVVLVDFWAYSCINCIRTLPYLNEWYKQYHDKGLIIIGVHSPEFDFEREEGNVKQAVTKEGILYPVALDNQFKTWENFHNHYWPAHYLIDREGSVVYEHFGEGDYDVMENNIKYLLGIQTPTARIPKSSPPTTETPETYLGYARAQAFAQVDLLVKNAVSLYHYPTVILKNEWALEGSWVVAANRIIVEEPNAALKISFKAGKVYAVMGNKTGIPIHVKVLFNGQPLAGEKGDDVENGYVDVDAHRLYTLAVFNKVTSGILELVVTTPGVEIYTFTFGS